MLKSSVDNKFHIKTIYAILWLFRIQIITKPLANTHHHNFAPVHSLVTEYLIVQKMVEVFLSAGYRLIQISLKLLYDGYVPVVAEQRRLYTCKYHRLILKRQISIQQIDPTRLWKAMSNEGLTTLANLRVGKCVRFGTGQILA